MKLFHLKFVHFLKDRYSYSYQTQVLAVVLFNYALLGLISCISLTVLQTYSYTWPFWVAIIIGALAFMEAALPVKNTKIVRELTLILSTLVFVPLGLYLSGSITTPVSNYLLLVLINISLLSYGLKRILYFSVLAIITVSFLIIENYFTSILLFSSVSSSISLKLWSIVFLCVAWIIFREVSDVTSVLSTHRKKLTKSNEDLYHESIVDSLTSVFTKSHLMQTLDNALLALRRKNNTLGILFLDIDDFKAYNDKYGHVEGDICLKEVATLIKGCVCREGDKVFRFGGEEFVVILDQGDLNGTTVVATKILDSLRQRRIPHECFSPETYVTVSIGISVYTNNHMNLTRDDLLKYPDMAMYEAKKSGKNQFKSIIPE